MVKSRDAGHYWQESCLIFSVLLGLLAVWRNVDSHTSPTKRPARPIVGAIRWDAWHGPKGVAGLAVERSLGPAKWHYRLPFYAKVLSDSQVSIDGASQQVMDQEIRFAAGAGLDYWAFVSYAADDPSSLAQPGYQKVLGNRPLVFLQLGGENAASIWGGFRGLRESVDYFRDTCVRNGAGNPYVVVQQWNPEQLAAICRDLGADAVSAYSIKNDDARAAPYSTLADYASQFWERCRDTGAAVVPIVMSGWDRRPRVEHPVPWETWQKPKQRIDRFYESPTPSELSRHLNAALSWVRKNPAADPANAVLIYAWNENDEGGWLVPTLNDGSTRLHSIKHFLRQ